MIGPLLLVVLLLMISGAFIGSVQLFRDQVTRTATKAVTAIALASIFSPFLGGLGEVGTFFLMHLIGDHDFRTAGYFAGFVVGACMAYLLARRVARNAGKRTLALVVVLDIIAIYPFWKYFQLAAPKTDYFLVHHSQFRSGDLRKLLAESTEEKNRGRDSDKQIFHVSGHALRQGDGTVFSKRWFSEGFILAIDDELYEKVTIWVRHPSVGKFSFGKNQDVIGYYSMGGSAWRENGCSTIFDHGTVEITQLTDAHADIRIDVDESCVNEDQRINRPIEIHEKWSLGAIDFGGVSPWLGSTDGDYSSTYRPRDTKLVPWR